MLVRVKDLVKNYGTFTAIENLNLEIQKKDIVGLVGPDGSGKTTFFKCLLSQITYDSGVVEIFDKNMIFNKFDLWNNIGFVSKDMVFFEDFTVKQNIDYYCGTVVRDKSKREKYVNEVIDFVKLKQFINFHRTQLTDEMRQRLYLACGIVHKPELIIIDELIDSLDTNEREKIFEIIKILNKLGATIIYASSSVDEVKKICNHIILLDKGRVIVQINEEQLYATSLNIDKITIGISNLTGIQTEKIKKSTGVVDIKIDRNSIDIYSHKLEETIVEILNFLRKHEISFSFLKTGKIF